MLISINSFINIIIVIVLLSLILLLLLYPRRCRVEFARTPPIRLCPREVPLLLLTSIIIIVMSIITATIMLCYVSVFVCLILLL